MHPATLLVLSLVSSFSIAVRGAETVGCLDKVTVIEHDQGLGMSGNDDNAVTTLTQSLTRSECHANIAATLRRSCNLSNSDKGPGLSELEKRGGRSLRKKEPEAHSPHKVAISFTLCSMQSAVQQIPIECEHWQPTSAERKGRELDPSMHQDQQTLCLGPQEWSAYNIYLTQLCHFLESRRKSDLAYKQYLDATKEQTELLRLMKERERAQLLRDQDWQKHLQDQAAAQQKIKDDLEVSVEVREDLQSTLKKLEVERAAVWERIEADMKDRLFEADSRFEAITFDLRDAWKSDFSANLAEILKNYEVAVKGRANQLDLAMSDWGHRAEHHFEAIFSFTTEQISSLQELWGSMQQWTNSANQELEVLDKGFMQLRQALAATMDMSYNLSWVQAEITENMYRAAGQAELLINKQDRLENSLSRSLDLVEKRFKLSAQWNPFGSLSLFSGPSTFSVTALGQSGSQILFWILQLIGQLIYSMISAACFLFIIFRTRFRKTMLQLSGGFWSAPVDEEEVIADVRPKARRIYPWADLASPHGDSVDKRFDRKMNRSVSVPI
uniref:Karyogamy protein 5 n=1 Tax=Kwoniella pini CBS 10737 TaxID=1296096 RepID=A0A1B9HUU7_9TREE|nr:uncharacterized protein I206_06813 [Kwoniella pini CBS 10737]OCF47039.1 hypothetical protein I206_06813 [Kwoniella pini CBS 10737]